MICFKHNNNCPDKIYRSDYVEYFEDRNSEPPNLKLLYEKFPNLKSIKCEIFSYVRGTFENLTTLQVHCFCYGTLNDLKLPNLKILKIIFHRIQNIYKQERINKDLWNNFIKNIPKVEHFSIEEVYEEIDLVCILKSLRILKNLKTFEGHLLEMYDTNIPNMIDIANHKILINISRKFIEFDAFLKNKLSVMRKIINKDYKSFELVQNQPTFYGIQTFQYFEIVVPRRVTYSDQSQEIW